MSETARFHGTVGLAAAAPLLLAAAPVALVRALEHLRATCTELPEALDRRLLAEQLEADTAQLLAVSPTTGPVAVLDARLQALGQHELVVAAADAYAELEAVRDQLRAGCDATLAARIDAQLQDVIQRGLSQLGDVQRTATTTVMLDALGELGWQVDHATGHQHTAIVATAGDRALAMLVGPHDVQLDVHGCDGPSCHDRVMEVFAAARTRGLEIRDYRSTYPDDQAGTRLVATAAHNARRHQTTLAHGLLAHAEPPAETVASQAAGRRRELRARRRSRRQAQ